MSRIALYTIFISVVILVVSGVHFYFWKRLVSDVNLPLRWRRKATITVIVLAAILPAGLLLGRALPIGISKFIIVVPFVWMGTMFLLFSLLVAIDVLKLCVLVLLKLSTHGLFLSYKNQKTNSCF